LDERLSKYLTAQPFIFMPFNAGPRICLGQQVCSRNINAASTIGANEYLQFAYNETSFMLIRLLQQVTEIKLVQEVHPEALPPPGWAESRFSDGKDKARIIGNLTMTVTVSVI
jgi:hypothetical protein